MSRDQLNRIRDDELYHHGIKGQKWGIRRYQNDDGTYTSAGKQRRREERKPLSKSTKTKIAVGVGLGLAAAGTAVYLNNNRDVLEQIRANTESLLKNSGKKIKNGVIKKANAAGEAAFNGAMASLGGIAIAKLSTKFAPNASDSEATKVAKKVAFDAASAGINSVTKSNGKKNQNGNSQEISKLTSEAKETIGSPNNIPIDKKSNEWNDLFKGRSEEERATIKNLSKAGYGLDQINDYIDQFMHMMRPVYKGGIMRPVYENELYHHGIKGQKWGVRRYQNEDGSLTSLGERRYNVKNAKAKLKDFRKNNQTVGFAITDRSRKNIAKNTEKVYKLQSEIDSAKNAYRVEKLRAKGKNERADKLADKLEVKQAGKDAMRQVDAAYAKGWASDSYAKSFIKGMLGYSTGATSALMSQGVSKGSAVVTQLLLGPVGAIEYARLSAYYDARQEAKDRQFERKYGTT